MPRVYSYRASYMEGRALHIIRGEVVVHDTKNPDQTAKDLAFYSARLTTAAKRIRIYDVKHVGNLETVRVPVEAMT